MTRQELEEYKALHQTHLRKGIGKIRQRARYEELNAKVREFIDSLADDTERRVMERHYIKGESYLSISLDLNYSERQVRRIHARIVNSLV